MTEGIAEKALSLLPERVRTSVGRARELESFLREGEEALATLKPRLRGHYVELLGAAIRDVRRARATAQKTLEDFERGVASEGDLAASTEAWSEVVARALFQRVDEDALVSNDEGAGEGAAAAQ